MRRLSVWLLLASLAMMPTAHAAPRTVDAVLSQWRLHGFASPEPLIHALQEASDRPGPQAPLEARHRYAGALGQLAVFAEDRPLQLAMMDKLAAMATGERCDACRAQRDMLEAQWLMTRDTPRARALIRQAEPLVPANDPALRARFLAIQGRALRLAGNYPQAIAKSLVGMRLATAANDLALQAELGLTLAVSNAQLGDFARADRLLEENFALTRRIGYEYRLADDYLNRSYILSLEQRDQEMQRQDLLRAYEIARRTPGLDETLMLSVNNLADSYLQSNENRQALEYARRAETLAREHGVQRTLAVAMANAGIALARLGQVEAGIAELRASIEIARGMGNTEHVVAIEQELAAIYERAGRYREALQAMHEIADLGEALTSQKRKMEVLALQEEFAAERQNREIARLSAENAKQQALVRARTAQGWLWVATAVALALAAVLLVQNLKRARRANRALAAESRHDPLTGACNRRHFEALMQQHEALALAPAGKRRYVPDVSLVVLDLDHFKRINDTWGHEAGDAVLVAVAERLQALVRDQDTVVRWGGEEFVLVLPGTGTDGMRVLVERILEEIARSPILFRGTSIAVTASAGGAAFPMHAGQRWRDAMQVADLALYLAKASGRNRACCVTGIAAGADPARLRTDLLAAQAAGEVTLDTIAGPVVDRMA